MDVEKIKLQFPAFRANSDWVYADNAATTQRPERVINAVSEFERRGVANVHRGLYKQAEEATEKFEEARKKTARFIGASSEHTIAFTKGTTEAINLVASCFLKNLVKPGDEVLITAMEHHSNLIPWQQVCQERQAKLKVIPINKNGDLQLDQVKTLLGSKTRMLAITHISNTLGTINPVKEIIPLAHQVNVPVLVDAAQSVSHYKIDVEDMGADFLVFSAHKMFGPFGVGVLYAHPKHHDRIQPLNFGGGAIKNVTFFETDWLDYPYNIEAGTQNISGVIGYSAALDWVSGTWSAELSTHVESLSERLREGIQKLNGFRIIGQASKRSGIVSVFNDSIHPHDMASFLASANIAVRAGHHCTQPLLDSLGIPATTRFSFSVYNTTDDVERILEVLNDLMKFWKKII